MDYDPIEARVPWMNFQAIDFLTRFSRPETHVFEYGSGGSTLFWAQRAAQVISVEHDMDWAQRLHGVIMREKLTHVKLIHQAPMLDPDFFGKKIDRPSDFISNNPNFKRYEFKKYVDVIHRFPGEYFDIVVVDGRARPSCIMAARDKVKRRGILVVDNTERPYILQNCWPVLRDLRWERKDFHGPVPFLRHFCKTTILRKP